MLSRASIGAVLEFRGFDNTHLIGEAVLAGYREDQEIMVFEHQSIRHTMPTDQFTGVFGLTELIRFSEARRCE